MNANPPESYRILIVDDTRAIHDDFRKILLTPDGDRGKLDRAAATLFDSATIAVELAPVAIDSAFQGKDGVMLVAQAKDAGRPYALAFVDVRMPPGCDGVEATVQLLEQDPDLQVVLCTAYSDYSFEEIVQKLGPTDRYVILKKPFDPIEVRQLTHALTEKWRLLQATKSRLSELEAMVQWRTRELTESRAAALRTMAGEAAACARAEQTNGTLRVEIAEREMVETALRESEERYRLLYENNPLPMWLYDLQTLRFLAVSESAVQQYGYTREEFLTMTIEDIRPAGDIPAVRRSAQEGRAEAMSSSEWRHRRKDGTIIQVEIFSNPLVFRGREARLVLASNITEKKLLEDKLLHAQRLESIGMLAAGIAHDLNNVLAPLMFAAPLLRNTLSTPSELNILATLDQCAIRGAGLVKQILGFARSTGGEFCPTQVKHLIIEIISFISETFPKSIVIRQQIPSDLWPVNGNATQIHQVLLNLCVNARDAMPQGGTLRIIAANRQIDAAETRTITGSWPGPWLVIEIADTGTGIPPEVLERIWTPFFTTKGVGKGTGLGLSTVRGIVASHQGFVDLDTAVGHGTTFRVFLPALERSLPRQATIPPFAQPDGHGELILVVDDEASIRDITSAFLRENGYRVVSCGDGVDAIALFNANLGEFSLVVTDVDMPRMGGVALVGALLKICPDMRIIAVSGLSRSQSEASGIAAIKELSHEFLIKPFQSEALLASVHRVLHPPGKP